MNAATTLASALAGLAAAALVHAQGTDELWNMTTRMEMEGMQMPPMSQQVCMKKGEPRAEGLGQQDPGCKVTEQHRTGNKLTWKVVCTGENAMTGSGEMTRNRDTLEGRMLMKSKDGDVKIAYSGRLGGTCNAQTHQDPQQAARKQQIAAMQAQGAAQLDQVCRESIEKFATQLFETQGNPCAARAGEYCAHVKKTAQSMRTPAGYRKAMQAEGLKNDGWERAARYCKIQPAPVLAAACKSALGGRDWQFVADFCPAESEKIAGQQCAGREYTVVMKTEYAPLCSRHSNLLAKGGGRSYTAVKASGARPAAAPSAGDAVKEGARALKNLFGR